MGHGSMGHILLMGQWVMSQSLDPLTRKLIFTIKFFYDFSDLLNLGQKYSGFQLNY